MLALFDLANPNECYERRESVIPQQSLALLNSALALDLSRLLARKLTPEAKAPEDFVAAVFEWVLSRQPSKEEMAASVKFLQTQPARLAKPGIAFTGAYIIYFKFVNPDANTNENWWFGVSPEGIGTVGMLLNFAVSLLVSRYTAPPPDEVQELVESIRVPRGAGEASEH